ncbi:MAG: T9SS type A sorting domain-containing protein [Ignavibacteria bacterium]
MIGILKRFRAIFIFAFAVSILSFYGSFDSNDQDYLDTQNLINNTGTNVTFTNPSIIQNIQPETINPISGSFDLVDTLTLNAPGVANNGGSTGWGMFLNLVGGPDNLMVVQMSTASTAVAGASFSVEIFTRVGNALGGPVGSGPGSSTAGWTSLGSVPVTQGATSNGISLLFNVPPITVNAGDTVGVAMKFTGAGPRYLGSGAPPLSIFADTKLTLITGDGRSVPFTTTGTFFSSRALTGAVRYILSAPPVTCSYSWGNQVSGVTSLFYSVKCVSNLVGWAAGAGGIVRRTTDGGTTWGNGNPNPGVITGDIYNIEALDANTAWVTTSPGATFIYKTTNGGANWTQVYTIAGGFINTIKMVSATNGYAFGDVLAGVWLMLTTVNGGSTWTVLSSPAAAGDGRNNCLQVSLPNIWFGTGQGTVWHSTNSGINWTNATVTGITGQITGVHFNSATIGIAGGSTMSKTTDGGATWTLLPALGTGTITGIQGTGTDYWYTRGTGIFRSTNDGTSWTQVHTHTAAQNDISLATDGNGCMTGWSGGATGTIAKMTGAPVGINDPISNIPNSFKLEQNYPNPFNPTTNITYALPISGNVELKIYDLLGREVTTLVNSFVNAGTHTINFDASSLSSGVYFYTLTSGNFNQSKKMLLLK